MILNLQPINFVKCYSKQFSQFLLLALFCQDFLIEGYSFRPMSLGFCLLKGYCVVVKLCISLNPCECLLRRMPPFKGLLKKIEEMPEFGAWLQQSTPEQAVPRLWQEDKPLTAVQTAMYQLLVIQVSSPTPINYLMTSSMKLF